MCSIEVVDRGSPIAAEILRSDMHDVASRYYGRPATPAEVDQALLDEPHDDLTGPTGVFLLAFQDDTPVACAGARLMGDTAELA